MRRRLDQRIEHRPELGARPADDLEDIAARGLIFQRLLQIMRALAQFGDQPSVLDCDHRLVGKGRDQLDLLFGETLDALTGQGNDPDRRAFAQQRHTNHCVYAANTGVILNFIKRVGPGIEDLNGLSRSRDPSDQRPGSRPDPYVALDLLVIRQQHVAGPPPIFAIIVTVDRSRIGTAQPDCRSHHSLQHGLQIKS